MTAHAKTCECGGPCGGGPLERPRYFPRQLVAPDDLNLAQDYFRRRLRLHNLMLHGWGVVCGAEVRRVPKPRVPGKSPDKCEWEPWTVKIMPGFVIGPCGDDIWIDAPVEFDVKQGRLLWTAGDPSAYDDEQYECSGTDGIDLTRPVHVAVRYKEAPTRPVRTQPTGCGCGDAACEYSRLRDCFEIGLLRDCPPSHVRSPDDDPFAKRNPPCPDVCCDDPWVVLARITPNDQDSGIKIENCACRRVVGSWRDWWGTCEEAEEGDDAADPLKATSLRDLEGVDDARLEMLHQAGIDSVRSLLTKAARPDDRAAIAKKVEGLGATILEKLASHADLLRVPGVGPQYAELLEKAGIRSVQDLADQDAKKLYARLKTAAATPAGRKLVGRMPMRAAAEIADWIAAAGDLEPRIEFAPAARTRTGGRRSR